MNNDVWRCVLPVVIWSEYKLEIVDKYVTNVLQNFTNKIILSNITKHLNLESKVKVELN